LPQKRLFSQQAHEAGKFSREESQGKAKDPIENIRTILMFATEKAKVRQSKSLARNLLKGFAHLGTFLYEEGIESTNNLRPLHNL